MSGLLERRQLLVGAGALVTAGVAFAAEPRRVVVDASKTPLGDLVPLRAGPWMGAIDPDVVPDSVDGSIDHGQTVTRRYLAEGLAPVMMVASYHGPRSPDLKVHRPETCYAVAGFEGGAAQPFRASAGGGTPAVFFTARRGERTETVLYWTRVGDRFPQGLSEQRVDFLLEALRGVRADGLLFRASTIGPDPRRSLQVLDAFSTALVAAATPQGRTVLLGPRAVRA